MEFGPSLGTVAGTLEPAGQRIFIVRREGYVCLVPFVEDEHTVFLKTIIRVERPQSSTSVRSPMMKMDADKKELLDSVSTRPA
jgi:hypothetical protein